ncbi:MAG: hypothetical protein HY331_00400, partial [Chloroflexi bacterium]|nr:hypothetical protein [Chloroflexota bacterium]
MNTQTPPVQASKQDELPWFDFETIAVGTDLGSVELLLTEQEFEHHRRAVEDPEAFWVTNELKPIGILTRSRWRNRPGQGQVNARHNAEYFNPP